MEIYMTILFLLAASILTPPANADISQRSYCGNRTVDSPFALHFGCGHPGFRDLFFCINDYHMLTSLSDPAESSTWTALSAPFTLHDPHLSDCLTLSLGCHANDFSLEPWRSPYHSPFPYNAFLLLGCSPDPHSSKASQTAVSPAATSLDQVRGVLPVSGLKRVRCLPPCSWDKAIKEINLSKLECEEYNNTYSLASRQGRGEVVGGKVIIWHTGKELCSGQRVVLQSVRGNQRHVWVQQG